MEASAKVKVYNPFNDSFIYCECDFFVGKDEGFNEIASIESILTAEGVELSDYMTDDQMSEVIQEFFEKR